MTINDLFYKGINTSVTEETNYYIGRFKHIFKHMNYPRFHFMLYIICDEFNRYKLIQKKYKVLN